MQIHSLIPDSELPDALKRLLVFGDREQISAIYALEARIEEMATDQIDTADGLLNYYNVEIEYTGTYNTKILAQNEADAKEKARDEVCMADVDMEEDFITVKQIK